MERLHLALLVTGAAPRMVVEAAMGRTMGRAPGRLDRSQIEEASLDRVMEPGARRLRAPGGTAVLSSLREDSSELSLNGPRFEVSSPRLVILLRNPPLFFNLPIVALPLLPLRFLLVRQPGQALQLSCCQASASCPPRFVQLFSLYHILKLAIMTFGDSNA